MEIQLEIHFQLSELRNKLEIHFQLLELHFQLLELHFQLLELQSSKPTKAKISRVREKLHGPVFPSEEIQLELHFQLLEIHEKKFH